MSDDWDDTSDEWRLAAVLVLLVAAFGVVMMLLPLWGVSL